jgi:hypothetical protein
MCVGRLRGGSSPNRALFSLSITALRSSLRARLPAWPEPRGVLSPAAWLSLGSPRFGRRGFGSPGKGAEPEAPTRQGAAGLLLAPRGAAIRIVPLLRCGNRRLLDRGRGPASNLTDSRSRVDAANIVMRSAERARLRTRADIRQAAAYKHAWAVSLQRRPLHDCVDQPGMRGVRSRLACEVKGRATRNQLGAGCGHNATMSGQFLQMKASQTV